jgi:hypothetical protein
MYWRRSTRPARPSGSAAKVPAAVAAAAAAAAAAAFPSPPGDRPVPCGAAARSLLVISSCNLGFLVGVESFAGSCAERRLMAGAVPPSESASLLKKSGAAWALARKLCAASEMAEDRGERKESGAARAKQLRHADGVI